MKNKSLIIGTSIAAVALCSLVGWIWLSIPKVEYGSPASVYVHLLQYFPTCTVEVKFEQSDNLHDVFGQSEDQLSDQALEIVVSAVKEKFEKIPCSRYGRPYSYETNPLNVSITFFLKKFPKNTDRFDARVYVQRSISFSFLMYKKESGKPLGTDSEEARDYKKPGDYGLVITNIYPFPDGMQDATELKKMFALYAAGIAQRMRPNYDEAVEAEARLFRRLHPK